MRNSSGYAPIYLNGLNLIVVTDCDTYHVWRNGTDELIARKPVTRDVAVELFRSRLADLYESNRD